VLDGEPAPSSPPPPKGGTIADPTFRPMYCGQTAAWIKMTLGMEVGLDPGHTLDGDLAPPPKGHTPNFRPMCVVAKRLDGSRCCHLTGIGLDPGHIVLDGDPSASSHPPPKQRGTSRPHFSAHVLWPNGWMDQDVTWQGGSCLGPGDIVLDGDPAPLKRGTTSRPPL